MRNLTQILNKLKASLPTAEPGIISDDPGKCPKSTGKIGKTTILTDPPGSPRKIGEVPVDDEKKRAKWAKIQENKIKAYFAGVFKAIRECGNGTSGCSSAEIFGECFDSKHQKLVNNLNKKEFKVSMDFPMEDAIAAVDLFTVNPNVNTEQSAPKQDGRTPTEIRNCNTWRDRCLCQYYTRQAEYMAKCAQQEMFYRHECGPYYIPDGLNDAQILEREAKNKKAFNAACGKIKDDVDFEPDSSPCKKKTDGKYYYAACSELCKKCLTGELPAKSIEGQVFQ